MADPPPLSWDLDQAINLLKSLSLTKNEFAASPAWPASSAPPTLHADDPLADSTTDFGLGDFNSLWDYLGRPRQPDESQAAELIKYQVNDETVAEVDLAKGVRWRDEVAGADLEDNVDPTEAYATSKPKKKRPGRKARARERADKLAASTTNPVSDTTDRESGEELESLRRSPDRRAVIDRILGRTRRGLNDSPPTSPSPPKSELRTPVPKRDWPVSNPFIFSTPGIPSTPRRVVITPNDGLNSRSRKQKLITELIRAFPEEKRYMKNPGLTEPAFSPLNVSTIGIHVFVDMSNISIGFHDSLKLSRGMSRDVRLRRVPLSFHNFSLVLERGRPACKRVLVGSDKYSAITQAKSIGYETNILERVHKAKELTPRQRKYRSGGETSGSETNTGLAPEKWVEQAVDEILHLKILESIIDAKRPSTIVLATGDAAEAEYSGGFLKMVERALEKGWCVELLSFKLNTSSLYKRRDFRTKWGGMFKLVELDPFVEYMIDEEDVD